MNLTIAQLQFQIANDDVRANIDTALRLLDAACERTDVDFVTLPELWNTGFTDRTRIAAEVDRTDGILRLLADRATRYRTNIVCGTLPEADGGKMYNTCMLLDREGRRRASFRKNKLFPGLGEHEIFEPGSASSIVELDGTRIGAMVCFDIRYPEIARRMTYQGAELLFVSAQFPASRLEHWLTLLRARAIENQVFVIATNGTGVSGGVHLCGHSVIINPWGEILSDLEENIGFAVTQIETNIVTETRKKLPCLEFPTGECRI